MKFKTSAKELKNGVPEKYLRRAGYCDLQALLNYEEPIAYSSGRYGWNFDVYKIGGHYITTGYRGMVGERANNTELYEKKAEQILYKSGLEYDDKKRMINALLAEFVQQM